MHPSEWIDRKLEVLDHGFIKLVEYMGDDAAIVQAARVSYGPGTKTPSEDRDLIRYLMRHKHTSPLEMCEAKFHVKVPIFVARQWVTHRTANRNEMSARYSVLPDEFYVPAVGDITGPDKKNRQSRGTPLPIETARGFHNAVRGICEEAYAEYEYALEKGVARELARILLPVNFYTEFYWKNDLHNILHFLNLRTRENAQYEIRMFAKAMAIIVQDWVPTVWEAFKEFTLNDAV